MDAPKRPRVQNREDNPTETENRDAVMTEVTEPVEPAARRFGGLVQPNSTGITTDSLSLTLPQENVENSGMVMTPKRPRLQTRCCEKENIEDGHGIATTADSVMHTSVGLGINRESSVENSQQSLVSVEVRTGFLARMQAMVTDNYKRLVATILYDSTARALLEIKHQVVHYHHPTGFIHRVRLIIAPTSTGYTYDLQVLFATIQTGEITSEDDLANLCTFEMNYKHYKFCPGIGYEEYHQRFYSVIRYNHEQVNVTKAPFQRVDSRKCVLWFKLAHNASKEEKILDEVKCTMCKKLILDLE